LVVAITFTPGRPALEAFRLLFVTFDATNSKGESATTEKEAVSNAHLQVLQPDLTLDENLLGLLLQLWLLLGVALAPSFVILPTVASVEVTSLTWRLSRQAGKAPQMSE
jgi:hypothetical protein